MGEIYTAGRSPAWQEWRQQFKGRDSITVGHTTGNAVIDRPEVIRHLPSCDTRKKQ